MKNKCKISIKKDGRPLYFEKGGKIECTKDIQEINELISIFNTKINFLKTVIAASENPEEVNERVRKIEKPRPDEVSTNLLNGKKIKINAKRFSGGLSHSQMELGEEFSKDREIASASLCFKTNKDIYYEDKLVVKKGDNIPYFISISSWDFDQNIAKVTFDIRPPGVYGTDFNPEKLNDGEGNYGEDFDIKVTPEYQVRV